MLQRPEVGLDVPVVDDEGVLGAGHSVHRHTRRLLLSAPALTHTHTHTCGEGWDQIWLFKKISSFWEENKIPEIFHS